MTKLTATETLPSVNTLVEKIGVLIERSQGLAQVKLGEVEGAIASLIEGSITSAELVAKFGKLSPQEMDKQIAELDQVKNSILVSIQKEKVAQSAIKLQTQKAVTVFTGLKAAFQMQQLSEKTMNDKQQAEFEGEKRLIKQEDRENDLNYRRDRNQLTKQEQGSKLAHQGEMLSIQDRIRAAVRDQWGAIADRKTAQTERAKNR